MAACALAIALAGCGGSDNGSGDVASNASGATAKAGATGSTGKSAGKKKSSNSKNSASAKKRSGSGSNSGGGSSKSDSGAAVKATPNSSGSGSNTTALSSADKKSVERAFRSLIAALDSKDVAYICGSAYSKAFMALMDKQGGCSAATTKQLANITGYSATITSVSLVAGSDLVAVNAKLKPQTSSGTRDNKGAIYFVKQSGSWKRAVPPSA